MNVRDAEVAIDCGVDAIGVIFALSPRAVTLDRGREIAAAVPAYVNLVSVFVDPVVADVEGARAAGFTPQFSGDETAQFCEAFAAGPYTKVWHVTPETSADAIAKFADVSGPYRHATWMFDTAVDGKRGGTGRTFDWAVARHVAAERHLIISGGLTPENVGSCIRRVRPYGVDVRSGVETGGVKDRNKIRAFVRAVKEADEQA